MCISTNEYTGKNASRRGNSIFTLCSFLLRPLYTEDMFSLMNPKLSTLCKYDLRKRDLFVLSWVRVR